MKIGGHGSAFASLPTGFAACSFPDDHRVVGVSRTQGEGQGCSSGVWGKSRGPQGQFLPESLGEGGCTALASGSAPPGFLLPRPVSSSLSFITFSHSDPCFSLSDVESLSPVPLFCYPKDRSPPGSSVRGDAPGKKTAVGCHALLQGDRPNPGIGPPSPVLAA